MIKFCMLSESSGEATTSYEKIKKSFNELQEHFPMIGVIMQLQYTIGYFHRACSQFST
jgi:hypothetical protein